MRGPLVSLNTDGVPQGLEPRQAEPNPKDRLGAGSSGGEGKGPLGQRLSSPAERADRMIAWEYEITQWTLGQQGLNCGAPLHVDFFHSVLVTAPHGP